MCPWRARVKKSPRRDTHFANSPDCFSCVTLVFVIQSGWLGLFGSGEIPLNSWWAHWTIQTVCSSAVATPLCVLLGGMYSGHDSEQINKVRVAWPSLAWRGVASSSSDFV